MRRGSGGGKLYAGMLAIAQGDSSTASSSLGEAGVISLAIAIGVAIGLGIGRDSIAGARHVAKRVPRRSADRS